MKDTGDLKTISDRGPFAAYRYDVTADIKWANAQMAHLFRMDPAVAARGAPMSAFKTRLVHPDDQDRVLTRLYKAMAVGEDFTETYRMIDAAGRQRFVYAQGSGLKDESTGHLFYLGSLVELSPEEITEHKAGTDLLSRLAGQLMQAREAAAHNGLKVELHLLDMAMIEIGQQLARAIKQRRTDWN